MKTISFGRFAEELLPEDIRVARYSNMPYVVVVYQPGLISYDCCASLTEAILEASRYQRMSNSCGELLDTQPEKARIVLHRKNTKAESKIVIACEDIREVTKWT